MGKRWWALVAVALLAAGLWGCARPAVAAATMPVATAAHMTASPLPSALGVDWSTVDRVVVADGRGGFNKPLTISDADGIQRFTEMLDGYRVIKLVNVDPVSGWTHWAKLYHGDELVADIVFGQPMQVSEVYYRVDAGDQSPRQLDELLHGINAAWAIYNP